MKKGLIFLGLLSACFLIASCDNKNNNNEDNNKQSENNNDKEETYYLVNFSTEGGTLIIPQTVKSGEKADRPDDPTKTMPGYTYVFAGWYTDKTYTEEFDFDSPITAITTIYAKWTEFIDVYTIAFDSNGGSSVSSQTSRYGGKLTKPTNPTKEPDGETRYSFGGWYKDQALTTAFDFDNDTITQSIILYAKWNVTNKFSVAFNSMGGTPTFDTQLVYDGDTATKPSTDPTKEDNNYLYDFTGWYSDENCTQEFDFSTPITDNLTLYAGWEIAEEIVHVNIYEGDSDNKELIETQTIIKYGFLREQLKEPSRKGYKFIDFHFVSSTSDLILPNEIIAEDDIEIYGEWEKLDMNSVYNMKNEVSDLTNYSYYALGNDAQQDNFYQNGYVKGNIPDFSVYQNTPAYVTVSTADEFINAISQTKCNYTNSWTYDELTQEQQDKVTEYDALMYRRNVLGETLTKDEETRRQTLEKEVMTYSGTLTQELVSNAKIHVIEITQDINLGYNLLSSDSKALVTNWSTSKTGYSQTSHYLANGVTQIDISNVYNLLIFSRNSSKITNAGFKINQSRNVVVRNIEMDEIWQWEDSPNTTPSFKVGDMDVFGWAYFKINFSTDIWIDHCTFGKSYDGQIDVANPYWYNNRTYDSAPYGVDSRDEKSRVTISNCRFNSGSDDPDGYLYMMMQEIEADYQKTLNNSDYACQYLYYKTLRDTYHLSFEEILYGVAIPQKKAFLLGDSSESKKAESYRYNQNLCVSILNNVVIDIEDRLPNVRGGIAYLANNVFDNTRYFKYRSILTSKGANNISSVNAKYKLALVSQGIVGGYGASIYAENCIFIGFEKILKNNNSDNDSITSAQMAAGYKLVNCIWYNNKDSQDTARIINTDLNPDQIQSTVGQTSPMSTTYFSWHNATETKPFDIELYDLDSLTSLLVESQHVGVNSNYDSMYIYTSAWYNVIK